MHRVQIAAPVLLALSLFLCWASSPPDKCHSGWFGNLCEFKCRCQSNACDNEGQCVGVSKCQGGWFGPACQYVDLAYMRSSHPIATDEDDDTCINNNDTHEVTVDFGSTYPITWVRLLVSEPGYLSRLRYRLKHRNSLIRCPSLFVYSPNDKMKDLFCHFNETVSGILIVGEGMSYLCSLYVSGGRNVALKQKTEMSSVYQEKSVHTGFKDIYFRSDLSVDGNTSQNLYKGSMCASTAYGKDGWLSIRLTRPALVNRFVIYNRDVAWYSLAGFKLVCFDEDGNIVFNYTDKTPQPAPVYTVTLAYSSIQSVTLHANEHSPYLLVCEVEIFGDFNCDYGTYGLACDKQCNCYFQEQCFLSTGGCQEGCSSGFIGEDCQTPCPPGQYGFGCQFECSQFCVNDSLADITCDHVSGKCLGGCQLGYMPPTSCPTGKYGPDCKLSCSPACRRPNEQDISFCDALNGTCKFGCDSGYYGSTCSVSCPYNHYGADCKHTCRRSCVLSNDSIESSCDYITGVCLYGCYDGYNGSFCQERLLDTQAMEELNSRFVKNFVLICLMCIFAALIAIAAFFFCLQKTPMTYPHEESESAGQISEVSTAPEVE